MSVIHVQKRDGSMQDWDREKILNAVAQVGLSPEETEAVSALIESWALKAQVNDLIKSDEIRAKIIELLAVVDPAGSKKFAAFKKA